MVCAGRGLEPTRQASETEVDVCNSTDWQLWWRGRVAAREPVWERWWMWVVEVQRSSGRGRDAGVRVLLGGLDLLTAPAQAAEEIERRGQGGRLRDGQRDKVKVFLTDEGWGIKRGWSTSRAAKATDEDSFCGSQGHGAGTAIQSNGLQVVRGQN